MVVKGLWTEDVMVNRTMAYAIRSERTGSPTLLKEVQQAVWSLNSGLPLANVQTLDEIHRESMAQTSFALVMLSIAAGVALLVAIVTLRTESAAAAGAAPIAAEVAGLHLAFLVAAGIGLVAVGLALTLRRTEVAPDHGPRPEPTDDEIAVADVDLR